MLDLSEFAEPPGEDESVTVLGAHARMMRNHGRLGTVARGDDRKVQRLYRRLTGRSSIAVWVDWDDSVGDNYLIPVTFRSQLQRADQASS